jgi:hypothetical protein
VVVVLLGIEPLGRVPVFCVFDPFPEGTLELGTLD